MMNLEWSFIPDKKTPPTAHSDFQWFNNIYGIFEYLVKVFMRVIKDFISSREGVSGLLPSSMSLIAIFMLRMKCQECKTDLQLIQISSHPVQFHYNIGDDRNQGLI